MTRASMLLAAMLLPLTASGQALGRRERATGVEDRPSGAPSPRARVVVECSNPVAPVRTIADGLRRLGDSRPAVILVSGTCRENVSIQGLDRITLQGNPTATIDGGTDPSLGTVELSDAFSIDLVDLTITGGGEGVGCGNCFGRLTRVTIQGSLGAGVSTPGRSQLILIDSVVRNNSDAGVLVGNASTVNLFNTAVTGNTSVGVALATGSTLTAFSCSITNNLDAGIFSASHGSVRLGTVTVTGNNGDGVVLEGGSFMLVTDSSELSANTGHQVRIRDLSYARFSGDDTVLGGATSTFPDVVCDPVFSATRGLGSLISRGTTTNCPAEQPPTP